MPNNEEVRQNFNTDYFNGLNFRLGWQTRKGFYNSLYNYPIYGVGFYSSTFKHKEFGNPYAIYGFVSVPIRPRSASGPWNFSYRIAFGMSSNFRHYDEDENPLNILIGSKRNCYIDLGLQAHYTLNQHFTLNGGLSFHHFSNGALQLPNKGLNLVPLTLSLSYIPGGQVLDLKKQEAPISIMPRSEWHVAFAAGARQMNMLDHRRYFKAGLGIYKTYSLGYKWKLGGGMDAFYSESGRSNTYAGRDRNQVDKLISIAPALYIDHVLNERLYINGGIGIYAHRNRENGENKPYYQRIGIRYKVWDKIFTGISIKAHAGSADFIEFSTGFSIAKK